MRAQFNTMQAKRLKFGNRLSGTKNALVCMLDMFNSSIMRFYCYFFIEESKIRQETVPKAKKNAKMSKSFPARTAPFSAVPTQVPTAQRVRLSCCGIPLIRCCCHSHTLAGYAAFAMASIGASV
jgi:hypothetical protein